MSHETPDEIIQRVFHGIPNQTEEPGSIMNMNSVDMTMERLSREHSLQRSIDAKVRIEEMRCKSAERIAALNAPSNTQRTTENGSLIAHEIFKSIHDPFNSD